MHYPEHEHEATQQFLYKKRFKKVIFTYQQTDSDYMYEARMAQNIFPQTMYHGRNEKNYDIRWDLRQLLTDPAVTDNCKTGFRNN